MTTAQQISIVVLTHNRVDELARTLRHLLQLAGSPTIIVVDNASTDGTHRYVQRHFPEVRLVRSSADRGSAARTLGAARVKTPFIAFCDDDTWWAPGALERACELLDEHPRLGAVAARVLVGDHEVLDPACSRMAASPLPSSDLPGPRLVVFMAGAVVMRAQAFRDVGGYEPRMFLGAEEALMGLDLLALGWQMVYARDVVMHHHPSTPRNATRRRLFSLRNQLWTAWLRLPMRDALAQTFSVLRQATSDGLLEPCLTESVKGSIWVLGQRRVVSRDVRDLWLKAIEGARVPDPWRLSCRARRV